VVVFLSSYLWFLTEKEATHTRRSIRSFLLSTPQHAVQSRGVSEKRTKGRRCGTASTSKPLSFYICCDLCCVDFASVLRSRKMGVNVCLCMYQKTEKKRGQEFWRMP
jgi:hypothetical protein